MPERLDRVQVLTASGTIVLSWDARQELLKQMAHLDSMEPVRTEFENAGASRPVRISADLEPGIVEVIEMWAKGTPGGLPALPEGVFDLRNALLDS